MNNLQKIASDISGSDLIENGARNDYYYELKLEDQKINFLIAYSLHVDNVVPIEKKEAKKIMEFLDKKRCGENNWYYDFKELV